MSNTKVIYPPKEILNPQTKNPNYEHIILWMLNNNEVCEWSDFTEQISESTLSGKLKKLHNRGFIDKVKRGHYQITPSGRKRFSELSYFVKSGKRKLNYPPKAITKKRNYEHIILWMLYNNESCKWSDFRDEPLSINQSSLSKSKGTLIDNGLIINENKEYKITPEGKSEYHVMLRQYDLDRQSILEGETKRIEEIAEKTSRFFNRYKIEDNDLKFRFLNNILKLDYDKVANTGTREEDFNKILLFLTYNHPDQFPDYISLEDFSFKYNIKRTTLDFFVDKIVNEEFYSIKFFKLNTEEDKIYYFLANETLEKILNAIVEKHITKFTYLNKFYESDAKNGQLLSIEQIIENILREICQYLFDERLEPALRNFIPSYISYLAYKIESEKKLVDSLDKLEGVAWQNIFDVFQSFTASNSQIQDGEVEYYYNISPSILEVLESIILSKIDFVRTSEFEREHFSKNNLSFIKRVEDLLIQGKIEKVHKRVEKNVNALNELENLILQDLIASFQRNYDKSLKITEKLIVNYPEDYAGYLFRSLTCFKNADYDTALGLIEDGLQISNDIALICQKVQILTREHKFEEAVKILDEALTVNPKSPHLLRTKSLSLALKSFNQSKDESLRLIESAIKIKQNDVDLLIMKAIILCFNQQYREAKKFLKKNIISDPLNKNPKIDTAKFFILAYSYIARGKFEKALDISDVTLRYYPNHPISFLTKAFVLGYNTIFKFQESHGESFMEYIDKAISLELSAVNKSYYYVLKSFFLQGIDEYEKAIEAIDVAIDLDPDRMFLYDVKMNLLITNNNGEEALELVEYMMETMPHKRMHLKKRISFALWALGRYEEGLESVEDVTELNRENADVLNNKAILYANLNRKQEAIDLIESIIKIAPKVGNFYDSYGEILMMFKEYEEAIKVFQEALKLDPRAWFAYQTHIKMGLCYRELGDYDRAVEHFEIGKMLTSKMLPVLRDLYVQEAENYLKHLKQLIKVSR